MPLIRLASGLASITTAYAVSSGVPNRPVGLRAIDASNSSRLFWLEGADAVLYELLVTCRKPPMHPGRGHSLHRGLGGGDRQHAGDGRGVGPCSLPTSTNGDM